MAKTRKNGKRGRKSRKIIGGQQSMFQKAKNMASNTFKMNPNTVAAMSAKLNAIIVACEIPYKFSDGSSSLDYAISKEAPANAENSGKGIKRVGGVNELPTHNESEIPAPAIAADKLSELAPRPTMKSRLGSMFGSTKKPAVDEPVPEAEAEAAAE